VSYIKYFSRKNLFIAILLLFFFFPIFLNLIIKFNYSNSNWYVKKSFSASNNYHNVNEKLSDYFDYKFYPLKNFLIALKNFIFIKTFPFRVNEHYIWDHDYGYIPKDTLERSLSNNKKNYNIVYSDLSNLNNFFKKNNINFYLITPPAKVEIIFNHRNLYFYENNSFMSNLSPNYHINYQNIYEQNDLTPSDIFSHTGFHWNFYSSCFFVKEILKNENINFIDCNNYDLKSALGTDQDIFIMHPFLFSNQLIPNQKYPKYPSFKKKLNKKILFIGDSYTDQLIYHLKNVYENGLKNLTFYDYFEFEIKYDADGKISRNKIEKNHNLINKILENEIVILVLSDSNFPRNISQNSYYGLLDYLKDYDL
jgi:hypothetical protein